MSPPCTFRKSCNMYKIMSSTLQPWKSVLVVRCFAVSLLGDQRARYWNHHTCHTLRRPFLHARNLIHIVFWISCVTWLYSKAQKVYTEVRIIMYQLKWHENYPQRSQILTGSGLATPILTVPVGAPFSACTASSRLPFSRLISLTNISRSPGRSLPSCSATPPGTNERITITVFAGSTGS